jgi:2-amino-4-hydroxy-6-hydroxymethyldihydropteridine diphosphokinase
MAAESKPVLAWVGLGSNLEQPSKQVRGALHELATLPDTRLTAASSLYRSAPMGPQDQPAYINAVARLETRLTAEALLDALLSVEATHGRVRTGVHWGPRTLDLDILLYGSEQLSSPHLTVPHPGIAERSFVLYPMAEIDPDLDIPGLGLLRELLAGCSSEGLERLVEDKSK